MRNQRKNKSKITIGIRFVIALTVVIGLVIGLGILRFHAARLAYYLESVNQAIQRYSDEEVTLRQELSALVAPIRIYSYCKESLGMQKVMKAETMPVRMRGRDLTASRRKESENNKGWRSGLAWLLGN
ncbi:MAG: hypothetical protein IJG34_07420 [Synergistaceae bacterium]|nr:hypothetical protein [Synergistaceae bacterium]MBQ3449703.1 hypothetical protein [Synergistaceae bacterium]MBR0070373.1 hypothetical protein [Synergistaceae bacterium]MBR0251574.1 hypothetical protein [Synergistaceae bacterium]